MNLKHKILLWMYVLIPKRNENRIYDAVYLIQLLSGIFPLVAVLLISIFTENYNNNPIVGVGLFIVLELLLWRYIKFLYIDRALYISILNATKKMNSNRLTMLKIYGILFFCTVVLFTMILPLVIVLLLTRLV